MNIRVCIVSKSTLSMKEIDKQLLSIQKGQQEKKKKKKTERRKLKREILETPLVMLLKERRYICI